MIRQALFFVLCAGFATSSAWADNPTETFDKLSKKLESVKSLYMASKVTVEENKAERTTTLRSWYKKSDAGWKNRTESLANSLDPKAGDKDKKVEMVSVCDGANEWREMAVADKKMVFKSKAGANTGPDLSEIKARLKSGEVKVSTGEKVLGHTCVMFDVNGTDNGEKFQATFWLSEDHGLVLKSRMKRGDRIKTEIVVTEVKVNDAIADSQFTYTPAADATVVDTDAMAPSGKSGKNP